MSKEFLPGAEPLSISGNSTGILLLHGAGGGTAWDLKEFAKFINDEKGWTVELPALRGFGTKPEDLFNVELVDWITDVERAFETLSKDCKNIFIVGHSVGGLLALLLAAERGDIQGIVTWAAPAGIQNRFLPILPSISKIPILRRAIPERYDTEIPNWLREQGWVGYDWIPTRIGIVLYDGIKRLRKSLEKINCPVLVIQGTEDKAVSKDSAQRIYDGISSERKEILILEGAPHPVMNHSQYKDDLFSKTIEFLTQVASK